MRRVALAVLLSTAMVACSTQKGSSESASADSAQGACIGAAGFQPPVLTLTDLQKILGGVKYYTYGLPFDKTNFMQLFGPTSPWTNWYNSLSTDDALAKLASMRAVLEMMNLHDTYLPGQRPTVTCTPDQLAVRQVDGTCNDPVDTMMGAANVRFGRNIPLMVPTPDQTNVMPNPVYANVVDPKLAAMPSPREVSRKLFTRDTFKPVPFLNMLAAAWVQFQVHDWFNHKTMPDPTNGFSIPLYPDDPLFQPLGGYLKIPATIPDALSPQEQAMMAAGVKLPLPYTNSVTHWWDASQIYGSDLATANSLRDKDANGNLLATLTIGTDGMLPAAPDGFEQTGFRNNWWLGLALLHNLFSREHNNIVAMLRTSHPEFTEQQLYDHARMINAADIAKIHTVEWTPAIIPNPTLAVGMNANWYGLKKFLSPSDQAALPQFFQQLLASGQVTQADLATILPAVNGVVGGTRDLHTEPYMIINGVHPPVPYSLTEEFVSVYRMHPLLPDNINVYNIGNSKQIASYPTVATRNAGARAIENSQAMVNLMYSFGIQHPGALVLQNYPSFLQNLQMPFGVIDMGTVDVLRDRERGLPRYNDFRQQIQLARVPSIEALVAGAANATQLASLLHSQYDFNPATGAADPATAIDRVDVLVGTFAEATRPTCYGFGETLFQVFTLMATRRLQGDLYYTDKFNAATYTQEGMDWIANTTFKSVLLRNFPSLKTTSLVNVQNAFYPWQ